MFFHFADVNARLSGAFGPALQAEPTIFTL
jgi:hypothetical protein